MDDRADRQRFERRYREDEPPYRDDDDYERERRYRSERYYGGGYDRPAYPRRGESGREDRGFFERVGDEVRSWLGNDEAVRRRDEDDRWSAEAPHARADRIGEAERNREEEVDRDWARKWGYIEGPGDRGRRAGSGRQGRYSVGDEPYDPGAGSRGEERSSSEWRGQGWHFQDTPSWSYTEVWSIPGPQTGRAPRGYQRSDDRVREDICERLLQHGDIDASDMEVAVRNGEVTLEGIVADRRMKRLAEDVAEGVRGVQEVSNRLRVKPGLSGDRGEQGWRQPPERAA